VIVQHLQGKTNGITALVIVLMDNLEGILEPASALSYRIDHAPEKHERAALPIVDGEQKGMVSSEDGNWRPFGAMRTAVVATAASVPSSCTSTKALWKTAERNSDSSCGGSGPLIPEKSAWERVNASDIPSARSWAPKSIVPQVALNLGRQSLISRTRIFATQS
jgi:hypothetical protein